MMVYLRPVARRDEMFAGLTAQWIMFLREQHRARLLLE